MKEAALAHINGDKVESAYLRTVYLDQRATLMEVWGRWASGGPGTYADIINRIRCEVREDIEAAEADAG